MKKIITLCLFAFAMIVGTQTATAQSTVEINAIAAKKTQELKKFVKFSDSVEETVYQIFQNYERKLYNMNESMASGNDVKEADKIELNNYVENKIRAVFNDQQYKSYLEFMKTPK